MQGSILHFSRVNLTCQLNSQTISHTTVSSVQSGAALQLSTSHQNMPGSTRTLHATLEHSATLADLLLRVCAASNESSSTRSCLCMETLTGACRLLRIKQPLPCSPPWGILLRKKGQGC